MTDKTVDSASDERTANNTMRHQYRLLTDQEKQLMTAIKDAGAAFETMIRALGSQREYSLAITKIEEAVMWAVRGLTK
jgi:hypothetical protein